MKNILTQQIQCFCIHQEEAASQKNYHISEHLMRGNTEEKANHYVLFVLPFKVQVCVLWGPNILEGY